MFDTKKLFHVFQLELINFPRAKCLFVKFINNVAYHIYILM